jgi:hypothetical protein
MKLLRKKIKIGDLSLILNFTSFRKYYEDDLVLNQKENKYNQNSINKFLKSNSFSFSHYIHKVNAFLKLPQYYMLQDK